MTSLATPSPSRYDQLSRLAHESTERPVWLRIGQLIDGISTTPIRDAHIVFDSERILFVGDASQPPGKEHLAPGQKAPDALLDDVTLLPCLIEAHAHMFLDGAPVNLKEREAYLKQPGEWMLERARARWHSILLSGIGTIRDAGDKHGVGLGLTEERRKRHDPKAPIPWLDSPGAAIHHKGRYGSFMATPLEDYASPAECVAARVAAGARRIKLLVSGIINFKVGRVTAPPQMPTAEVAAFALAARGHGLQTFAHASGAEGVENSIEGGVNTVEHGFFVTDDQLSKMRDRQIAWVPTFAPVQVQIDRADELGWSDEIVSHLKRIIDDHRQMLVKAAQMGVRIVAGSDAGSCGVPHGTGFLRELCHMEEAGLAPMTILRSATGISAAVLDFPEAIGRLAAGYRSRFIFTAHDPLRTIANLQREKTIFFDGTVLECEDGMDDVGL